MKAQANISERLTFVAELRASGRHQEADYVCQEILSLSPGNVWVRISLGDNAKARGDLQSALTHYQDARARERKNITALTRLCDTLRLLGRAEQTLEILSELKPSEQQEFPLLMQRANSLRSLGNHEQALLYFEQARARNPRSDVVNRSIVIELRVLKRYKTADQFCQDMMSVAADAWAAIAYGDNAAAQGDRALALSRFESGLNKFPLNETLIARVSEYLRHFGRIQEALNLVLDAMQKISSDALIPEYGKLIAYTKSYREALDLYQSAVASNVRKLSLFQAYASMLLDVGRTYDALQLIESVSGDFASNFGLQRLRCAVFIKCGDLKAAHQLIHSLAPNTAHERQSLAFLRAKLFESEGDISRAIQLYTELALDAPACYFTISRLFLSRGDICASLVALKTFYTRTFETRRNEGLTTNWTQNLPGQIINEAGALGLEVKGEGPFIQERLDTAGFWARCLNESPETTFFAINFLRTWIAENPLPVFTEDPGTIPNKIMQFWHSSDIPLDVQDIFESHKRTNSGFQHYLFNEESARSFIKDVFGEEVLRVFLSCTNPAQKADFFRLIWLYKHGGFYCDADDRAVADLDPLTRGCSCVLYFEDIGNVANNFMGFMPAHPVLERCLQSALQNLSVPSAETTWLSTGPGLLTRELAKFLLRGEGRGPGIRFLRRFEVGKYVAIHSNSTYKHKHKWLDTMNKR